MKIDFDAPKGSRLNKNFYGITIYNKNNNEPNYWWDNIDKKWITNTSDTKNEFSNYCPCKSLKAFKRHVRKHMNHINNVEIRLSSNFVGYDCWVTQ